MKKVLLVVLSIAMVFSLSMTSFAIENSEMPRDNIGTISSMEEIITQINAEYGTDFYIPSTSNSNRMMSNQIGKTISKDMPTISIDLASFEKELRESAELLSAEQNVAKEKWNNAVTESKLTQNQAVDGARLSTPLSGTQSVRGASIWFEGWARDTAGYWAWDYLNSTKVTTKITSGKYQFFNEGNPKYDAAYIDARRTCAVNYYGTMQTLTAGFWIPSSYTHYLEWYAPDMY